MSVARTIETALCDAMRREMSTLPNLWIRASRNQTKDLPNNGLAGAVAYPQIKVAVSSKYYTNNYATWACDISVSADTHIDDDPTGTQLADIEDALEVFFDGLADNTSDSSAAFLAEICRTYPSFNLGALLPDPGAYPEYAEDSRHIGLMLTLHFAI